MNNRITQDNQNDNQISKTIKRFFRQIPCDVCPENGGRLS